SHLLSPHSLFAACADTHSLCDAIHSEDSNLFRFMKNSHFSFWHPPVSAFQFLLSALAILALCRCTGTRALKGGKAFTARTPAGGVSQVLLQGENPSQATKQDQETVKVRTYTLPAGTRIEQSPAPTGQPSTTNYQPSTFAVLSAPTSVTEREESRAKTELGAAQKDTARELGAKLSSLKGLVWVGLVMFVFGIASFAWPPL